MDETSKTTFNTPCTPPQAEGATVEKEAKKYNSERTYDIGDIRKTMNMILPKEYLERTDLTNAEKRVLAVILHTCRSDSYKKLGGYYPISNANLKTNAKIGSTGLTPITNHLKELGLIDFEQGEGRTKGKQRKATRYTILFDDKLIKKERFITDTINPSGKTINPSDGTATTSNGCMINPSDDQIKPSQVAINPSVESINPSQDTTTKSNDGMINPSEDSIKPSVDSTINPRTSTSADNQGVTPIEDGKSGAVYVKGDLNRKIEGNIELNLKIKRYLNLKREIELDIERELNVKLKLERNIKLNIDGYIDGNGDIYLEVEDSINNNNVGNTNNNMKELLEKIYDKLTSIDINTRVKSDDNAKLIEEKDKIIIELQGKNQELNELIKTKDEILDNLFGDYKELCGEYVKLIRRIGSYDNVKETPSKSNVETKTTTASSSTVDKIMTHQLGLAASNPIKDKAWEREQQKKVDTKTASKSNVGIVQESNSRERSYTLNKLRKEIVEPFKWMISNINDYGKLLQAEKDFNKAVNNLYSNHSNVITKSEIEPFIDEVRTVIQQKEEELTPKTDTNKTQSKSNDEAKATTTSKQEQCHFPTLRENQLSKLKSFMETFKERISKATDKETLEAIEADFQEDGINFFNLNKEITKEDVTHYSEEISKAFQAKKDELSPKVDTKTVTKVTVQEPSNEDGKRFHTEEKTAPKAETSEEKKETTAEPSTANSKSIEVSNVDTSDNKEEQKKLDDELGETASTKKSEEVEIPKAEEQKQLQELKETLKPLLENFNEVGTSEEHERILNEIRKAYTTKWYSQKVLQAFLDFATAYSFYAEKRDIVEAPHQETPSEEPRDEYYWNNTFTDEQAQEALSRLPKPNKRLKEEDDQEEVIDDDMPSDKEVASVVGGYDEENDAMF